MFCGSFRDVVIIPDATNDVYTACSAANQSTSLLVDASNREGISRLNLAHLRRRCGTIRRIVLCR